MKLKLYMLIIFASIFAIITTVNAQSPGSRFSDRNAESIRLAMMGGGMMGGQGNFNGFGWGQGDTRVPANEYQRNPNLNNQDAHREEIQRPHDRIDRKRRELSSLYQSGAADKGKINKKIDELYNLERDLDHQTSGNDNRW
jgi:hypothetical protein